MSLTIRSLASRLRQRLTQITQKSPSRHPAPRHKARLGLEQFEAREVPAALTWTNLMGNNDFYTASNWNYSGTSTIATTGPMAGDDLTFDGGVSSANCNNVGVLQIPGGGVTTPPPGGGGGGPGGGTIPIGPGSGGTGLNSFRLVNGYAGTVKLQDALQTATFVLSAASTGAISQTSMSGMVNDITVTDSFTWTRGILNSSNQLATVHLQGVTTTISPGANVFLTGSTLSFERNGLVSSSGTFTPGEIDFTNNAGIDIGEFCTVNVVPTEDAVVTHKGVTHTGGKINVKPGGYLNVYGTNNFQNLAVYDVQMPVVNSGETSIYWGAKFKVLNVQTTTTVYSAYWQTGGKTTIENGSVLSLFSKSVAGVTGPGGMYVQGGDLITRAHSLLAPVAGDVATIEGNLTVNGDVAVLPSETLYVTGNVIWSFGSYNPYVSVDGTSSLWKAGGSFTISGNTVNLTPIIWGNNLNVGQTWKVIQGNNVVGLTPPVNGDWTFLAPNPATEWDVKWK